MLQRALAIAGISVLVFGASFSVSETAFAKDTEAKEKVAEAKAKEKHEIKQVCKKTKVTGSNRVRKVCMPAERWEAAETAGVKATRQIQRRALGAGDDG